jgi:hypothetical protein
MLGSLYLPRVRAKGFAALFLSPGKNHISEIWSLAMDFVYD